MIRVSVSSTCAGRMMAHQRRRHRKGREQAAGQRIGVGSRHRAEDVAFHATQGEQRQEGRDDDRGREEDRSGHVSRRRENGMMLHGHHGLGEIAARSSLRKRSVCASRRKIASTMMTVASTIRPKSIAPTDSRLADSPRSTRMLTAKNSANGIVAPTISGAAQVAQEDPLQQDDQHDADHHVLEHGLGRDLDQILAVVDALDPHARRQNGGAVDVATSFSTLSMVGELCSPRRIRTMPSTISSSWFSPAMPSLGCSPTVTVATSLTSTGVPLFDEIMVLARAVDGTDQADAAHHRGLRADVDGIAADVDVRIAHRLQQLRQRQSVRHQLVEIDLKLVGLGLAAPAGDVDHARHELNRRCRTQSCKVLRSSTE